MPEAGAALLRYVPWRLSVSWTDWLYAPGVPPTGGSLTLAWHDDRGPVIAASAITEHPPEPYNLQPQRGFEGCFTTPEVRSGQFSTAHYAGAAVSETNAGLSIQSNLVDENQQSPVSGPIVTSTTVEIVGTALVYKVAIQGGDGDGVVLRLPLISQPGAERQVDAGRGIVRLGGTPPLDVELGRPIRPGALTFEDGFNPVPGFMVTTIVIPFTDSHSTVELTLRCPS